MSQTSKAEVKFKIIMDYAEWTVVSALRSGSPVKSRDVIYPALKRLDLEPLLNQSKGRITAEEFDVWHANALETLVEVEGLTNHYGWAAKMTNVLLKTLCFVGGYGRENLVNCIHPPIDGGLWRGLAAQFGKSHEHIVTKSHAITTIRDIQSLKDYVDMMAAMKALSKVHGCELIELEQFWLKS